MTIAYKSAPRDRPSRAAGPRTRCAPPIPARALIRLTVQKETKIANAATFTIEREDHTLGNMLRMCAAIHRAAASPPPPLTAASLLVCVGSYLTTLRSSSRGTASRIRSSPRSSCACRRAQSSRGRRRRARTTGMLAPQRNQRPSPDTPGRLCAQATHSALDHLARELGTLHDRFLAAVKSSKEGGR